MLGIAVWNADGRLAFAQTRTAQLSSSKARIATPVILISIDTLRADRLGAYGARRKTPNIDAFAKSAALFSSVSAPTPLTLPSHTSLFTSTYPFTHGIDDNGRRLPPNTSTLAAVLRARGYSTAAFVGGFVLDRRFGLDQGFDVYDSPFALHRQKQTDPGDIKRLGTEVTGAARAWVEKNGDAPFFLFLHLYDLHTPYNLPAEYKDRSRGLAGYDAELGYVDDVLGDFWKFLDKQELLSKSLIILTSDHGESLGDHGESTHGYFIYQSTVWVPLIIRFPSQSSRYAIQTEAPASLIDVAPTILRFLGITFPRQFQGRSLISDASDKLPDATPSAYSETQYGYNHFGVSSLRSLRVGRHKYIEAPKPEMYDLTADPGETRNLYADQQSATVQLRERLLALQGSTVPPASSTSPNPEEMKLLKSLGYLGSSSSTSGPSPETRADPKDRINEYEAYGRALALASAGRIQQSNTLLEDLLRGYPQFLDARMTLGVNQQRQSLHSRAVENFQLALKQDPKNSMTHFNLAVSYYALRRFDDAIREAEASTRLMPQFTRADELLGTIYVQRKQYSRAETYFNRILARVPDDYSAHHNLGVLATIQKKWTDADQHLSAAVRIDPESAEARNSIGSLYLLTGRTDQAVQVFGEATRLAPKSASAHYNLGLALRKQEKRPEAAVQFREAIALDPAMQAARAALMNLEKESN